jgi:hypothetical protein
MGPKLGPTIARAQNFFQIHPFREGVSFPLQLSCSGQKVLHSILSENFFTTLWRKANFFVCVTPEIFCWKITFCKDLLSKSGGAMI